MNLLPLCCIALGLSSLHAESASSPNYLSGEGVSLGGILFPHFHAQGAYGFTTANSLDHFAAGHHDPSTDGWTIQGIEAGLSLKPTTWFDAFTTYHLYQDARTRHWDGKFDEWFGRFKNLPGGLELRGGRFFNHFGFHNSTHLHGWSFIDNNLVNGRFLGDDGLTTIGGEISWLMPLPWTSLIGVTVGEAQAHGGHGNHAHAHEGYEAEQALFDGTLVSANWTNRWNLNDFHQFQFGFSGAWGDNAMGRASQVYGAHVQYEWRENGLEPGGRYFRWRTEAMIRKIDFYAAHEESHEQEASHEPHDHDAHEPHESHDENASHHVHRGSDTEFGIYTAFHYGFDQGWELGLRGEYVSGLRHADLDERYRVSPSVSYYINSQRTLYVRGQYNYDHSPAFKDEHSVWLQVGFNWGGAEVR